MNSFKGYSNTTSMTKTLKCVFFVCYSKHTLENNVYHNGKNNNNIHGGKTPALLVNIRTVNL